jgi:hypothetical protein
MSGKRILVACELQSYRQALAAAFRELRPDVEVFEAEKEDLDREVERLAPDLVVCSGLTPRVEDLAPSWVELYPDHGARSVVSVLGERSIVEDIQLSDLLSIIDRSEGSLLDTGRGGSSSLGATGRRAPLAGP